MSYNAYVKFELAHGRPKPKRVDHALLPASTLRNIKAWETKATYGENISNVGVKNQYASMFKYLTTAEMQQLRYALTGKRSSTLSRSKVQNDIKNALNKMVPNK